VDLLEPEPVVEAPDPGPVVDLLAGISAPPPEPEYPVGGDDLLAGIGGAGGGDDLLAGIGGAGSLL